MKVDLRQKMREEAARHDESERAAASRELCQRIRAQPLWEKAHTVLLFVPTRGEPDISDLMNEGKQISLPAFDSKSASYQPRGISATNFLVPGQFGIPEPVQSCPLTDLAALDLVLAPGVAFALNGTRLGRGKGYYDRLLSQISAPKCGVCFDWQILPVIPRDGHDVLMDYIASPSQWHRVTAREK